MKHLKVKLLLLVMGFLFVACDNGDDAPAQL
jgi:hypothetical protein